MYRITSGMLKDTMMYNLRNSTYRMNRAQDMVGSGKKATLPHQDPSGVIDAMQFKSRLTALKQYQDNVKDGDSHLKFYDTALESSGQILLRMKELAVQAANGTYNEHDRKIAAAEVDQLLRQMIQIGNTRYKGETIFSGFKINEKPFRAVMENVPGTGKAWINKVIYQGDIGKQKREVEQQQHVAINLAGNRVFWGDNMRIASSTTATQYKAPRDQVFKIDGQEIQVKAGDTLPVIVQKINNTHIPVNASIDNTRGTNLLVLESTDPHQVWVEDIRGGTVMQDLGIISRGQTQPPNNFSPTTKVDGGSIFDQVIRFRNALLSNDTKTIGSRSLGELNRAIKQMSLYRGEVGALTARLEAVNKRLYTDQTAMTDVLSKTEDVDMAEAVTHMKMIEHVRQAAMQVGARIIPRTLMDFLR